MAPAELARVRRLGSRSPEATEELGRALGRALFAGSVVALTGDLGSGKTCLVRGIARGLDILAAVTSPTFALLNVHAGRLPLYHFDAWMEGREKALFLDGGDEWLHANGVSVVEWADRVAAFLPDAHLAAELEHRGPSERHIRLQTRGGGPGAARYQTLLAGLSLPDGIWELDLRAAETDPRLD